MTVTEVLNYIREIINYKFYHNGEFSFGTMQVIILLVIFLVTKYGVKFILKAANKWVKEDSIGTGRKYAFEKFLRYCIYIIAAVTATQSVGIDISILLAGSAALMVGIGFGLQQTANDFISGIIILLDGSVDKGNILTIGDDIGTINEIGLRTSKMKTLDNRFIIIPNSKLVNDNVTNWSHDNGVVRFCVKVGVAYGTDTDLVESILLNIAREEDGVLNHPEPFVRFEDFGASSLDFELHFFHRNILGFKNVNSNVRKRINAAFNKQGIAIPFPQRDLWIKNPVSMNP